MNLNGVKLKAGFPSPIGRRTRGITTSALSPLCFVTQKTEAKTPQVDIHKVIPATSRGRKRFHVAARARPAHRRSAQCMTKIIVCSSDARRLAACPLRPSKPQEFVCWQLATMMPSLRDRIVECHFRAMALQKGCRSRRENPHPRRGRPVRRAPVLRPVGTRPGHYFTTALAADIDSLILFAGIHPMEFGFGSRVQTSFPKKSRK